MHVDHNNHTAKTSRAEVLRAFESQAKAIALKTDKMNYTSIKSFITT